MASRNANRRRRRRVRRKMKTSFKIFIVVIIVLIIASIYLGVLIYKSKHGDNPYGNVGTTNAEDDSFDISDEEGVIAKYVIYNVGKGEAILAKYGDTEILIDTGNVDSADSLVDSLQGDISGDLEYVVITNDEEGRTGGLDYVFSAFNVKKIIIGELGTDTKKKVKSLAGKNTKVVNGKSTTFDVGKTAEFSILKPDVSSSDVADKSLVTYFSYGEDSFLALSGAGKEEAARVYGSITDCSVIVLSSYGANDKANLEKPDKIYCSYMIASTDSGSGFPSAELKDAMQGRLFATFKNGTITFTTNGDTLEASVRPSEGF